MHHGAWFHVSENDVFPEQFPRFLGLDEGMLDALMQAHGEIFEVSWWQQVQERILAGGFADVPPYAERVRLARVKPG
jgi:isocitrate dehydrogenase kinase/phosphatase